MIGHVKDRRKAPEFTCIRQVLQDRNKTFGQDGTVLNIKLSEGGMEASRAQFFGVHLHSEAQTSLFSWV